MSLNLKTTDTVQGYRALFEELTKLSPSEARTYLCQNPAILAHVETPNPKEFMHRFDARKLSDWRVFCSALKRYFNAKAQSSHTANKSYRYIIAAKNNATPKSRATLYYTGIRGFSWESTDAKAWTLRAARRHLDYDCIRNLLAAGLIAEVEILDARNFGD